MTATTAAVIALALAVAQFLGKVIPDSATGVLGVLRKIAKITSLYIENRK